MDRDATVLLLVDLQARLMPAIDGGAEVVERAGLLLAAARLLGVPVLATEQSPARLGTTLPALALRPEETVAKMAFDGTSAIEDRLPPGRAVLVAGCEAHVCVLQTVLGLLAQGTRVLVAADAMGSRLASSREAALTRMAAHGAEVVTAEMAVFEWLGTAEHPRFREALALVR